MKVRLKAIPHAKILEAYRFVDTETSPAEVVAFLGLSEAVRLEYVDIPGVGERYLHVPFCIPEKLWDGDVIILLPDSNGVPQKPFIANCFSTFQAYEVVETDANNDEHIRRRALLAKSMQDFSDKRYRPTREELVELLCSWSGRAASGNRLPAEAYMADLKKVLRLQ